MLISPGETASAARLHSCPATLSENEFLVIKHTWTLVLHMNYLLHFVAGSNTLKTSGR